MSYSNFGFGGEQRTKSHSMFSAGRITNSEIAVQMPAITCEKVMFQNDPASSGDAVIGAERLGVVGSGIVLAPGENSRWVYVNSLDLMYHKEDDATTYLNYMLIGELSLTASPIAGYLRQENSSYLLQEDGDKIIL